MSFSAKFPQDKPLVTVTQRTHGPWLLSSAASPLTSASTANQATWIIEFHNGDDSRLTHEFIAKAFMPALDAVERSWRQSWREAVRSKNKEGGRGALIIVGNRKQNKFFSNGQSFGILDITGTLTGVHVQAWTTRLPARIRSSSPVGQVPFLLRQT